MQVESSSESVNFTNQALDLHEPATIGHMKLVNLSDMDKSMIELAKLLSYILEQQ